MEKAQLCSAYNNQLQQSIYLCHKRKWSQIWQVRGQGQMLLFIYKMGIHWYFRFAVETADNRDILRKYKALKRM